MNTTKTPGGLDRRTILQFGAAALLGVGLATLLRNNRSVGEDVGDNGLIQELRADRSSPMKQVPGADLTIISFNDFNCAACRKAHPAIQLAAAEDGRCNMVYKDWPIFGASSERAARIAIAADWQGLYPQVYDRLMRQAGLGNAQLQSAVEQSGGSWDQLLEDLNAHQQEIEDQLDRNRLQAFSLNLQGTPAFLIGPILIRGAVSQRDFARAISAARESDA
ncbi:MAG: DsbA family protein [Pseudomonadota bacterium]